MALDPDPARSQALTAALRLDMARLARELGMQSLRTSVVDLASMVLQSGWTLGDTGETSDAAADRTLDSVFPGGGSRVHTLADASEAHTLVQKLSPRLWMFAWRLDGQSAVLCETQFSERRDSVSDTDTKLIRLLCTSVVRAGLAAPADQKADPDALTWPRIDRRARPQPVLPPWLLPTLLVASGLLAAWLALWAVPRVSEVATTQQAQLAHWQATADRTVTHGLATALATGDYGEVQTALALYQTQGYFKSAAVTNARQRVVATVGAVERQRIGDPLTPDFAAQARPLDLKMGSDRVGQVLLVEPAIDTAAAGRSGGPRLAALLLLAGCATSLGTLVYGRLRRRR